jgi:hypothetical protein
MSLGKPEYVSDLVVYLLNRLGVEYVTLNPGATTTRQSPAAFRRT